MVLLQMFDSGLYFCRQRVDFRGLAVERDNGQHCGAAP